MSTKLKTKYRGRERGVIKREREREHMVNIEL